MNKINKKDIIDFLKDLIIIAVVVLIIRTFIAEPFQISGQSMYKSYYDKDFIIVDRFSYLDIPWIKHWEVKRWDVIVFKPHVSKKREYYIKRVIWLPWDKIKFENWEVYLQKEWKWPFLKIDEPYLDKENKGHTYVRWIEKEFDVPKWEYFAMWDNRNHSDDSRTCFDISCSYSPRDSYIPKKDIVWKVFLDLWYFNIKKLSFIQPNLWIDTKPRWLSSPSHFDYKNHFINTSTGILNKTN